MLPCTAQYLKLIFVYNRGIRIITSLLIYACALRSYKEFTCKSNNKAVQLDSIQQEYVDTSLKSVKPLGFLSLFQICALFFFLTYHFPSFDDSKTVMYYCLPPIFSNIF